MCFNANISISTFLLGLTAIIIGLINKVITYDFSIFYMSVIIIQLLEFFLWKNLNNEKINKLITIIIYIVLNFQLFAFNQMIYPYYKELYYLILIILLITFIYNTFYDNRNYITTKNKISKTLNWNLAIYDNRIFYLGIFVYVFMQSLLTILVYINIKNKYYKYLLIIYFIINLISISIAYIYYFKYGTPGSTYCIFQNIFSFAIIIISIIKN